MMFSLLRRYSAVLLLCALASLPARAGVSPPADTTDPATGTNQTATNSVLGTTAGAAVITDANGTLQQYLRGLVKQWTAGTLVLGAGTALVGAVETFHRIDVTPTVQNASYVSGNDLGGLISFTLPRTASGYLQSVGVQFIGGATTQINVACFDSNPSGSTFTDKSTFTIAAADQAKKINKSLLALTPVAQTGDTVTSAAVDNYAQPFNSTGTIYCAYVATGTFTPATTTDMRANIKVALSAQ